MHNYLRTFKLRSIICNGRLHIGIFFDLSLDGFRCVDDRRMISAAKFIADTRKRCMGVFAAQIHRDLAWKGEVLGASMRFQVAYFEIVMVADGFLDTFDCDFPFVTL